MGMIGGLVRLGFGDGRNLLRDTVEVFRENAEAGALRAHEVQVAALGQYAAEFTTRRNGFDSAIDGLNRLPRPLLALGTIGLFVTAMVDPVWFAGRMAGLAAVPEALWWLMGAVISFYFGARHQLKGQEFQRDLVRRAAPPPASRPQPEAEAPQAANPALEAWRRHDR